MQLKASVVHIHGAHEAHIPVGYHGFRVQQAGRIGKYLYIMLQQLAEIGQGHHVGKFVVRDAREHQAHIHSAVCSDAERADHGLVNGQVGGRDPDIAIGIGNKLLKSVLSGVDRVIIRAVHQGLTEFATFRSGPGPIAVPRLPQLAAHTQPQIHKLPG